MLLSDIIRFSMIGRWQHVFDRRMKVGMEFDLLFRFLHGLTNTDTCAEGFSAADEFRIVQTSRLQRLECHLILASNLMLTSTCRQTKTSLLLSSLGHISF